MRLLLTGSLCALVLVITSYASAAPPANQTTSGTDTQNWDRKRPSSTRFTVLAEFNNTAVRDNETGLVWEQSPDPRFHHWGTTPETFGRDSAPFYCAQNRVGGRYGWRLPSFVELASLL